MLPWVLHRCSRVYLGTGKGGHWHDSDVIAGCQLGFARYSLGACRRCTGPTRCLLGVCHRSTWQTHMAPILLFRGIGRHDSNNAIYSTDHKIGSRCIALIYTIISTFVFISFWFNLNADNNKFFCPNKNTNKDVKIVINNFILLAFHRSCFHTNQKKNSEFYGGKVRKR